MADFYKLPYRRSICCEEKELLLLLSLMVMKLGWWRDVAFHTFVNNSMEFQHISSFPNLEPSTISPNSLPRHFFYRKRDRDHHNQTIYNLPSLTYYNKITSIYGRINHKLRIFRSLDKCRIRLLCSILSYKYLNPSLQSISLNSILSLTSSSDVARNNDCIVTLNDLKSEYLNYERAEDKAVVSRENETMFYAWMADAIKSYAIVRDVEVQGNEPSTPMMKGAGPRNRMKLQADSDMKSPLTLRANERKSPMINEPAASGEDDVSRVSERSMEPVVRSVPSPSPSNARHILIHAQDYDADAQSAEKVETGETTVPIKDKADASELAELHEVWTRLQKEVVLAAEAMASLEESANTIFTSTSSITPEYMSLLSAKVRRDFDAIGLPADPPFPLATSDSSNRSPPCSHVSGPLYRILQQQWCSPITGLHAELHELRSKNNDILLKAAQAMEPCNPYEIASLKS